MIRNTSRLRVEWENYKKLYNIENNRKLNNVMCRHAFMVASRELYTTKAIGGVVGRDHASVIHATNNHDSNYRWNELYREAYHYACEQMREMKEMSDHEFQHTTKYMWLEENIKLRHLINEKQKEIDELSNRHSTSMGANGGDQLLELHI